MTHTESLELLPWYDSLDVKQRRKLDAHLEHCAECAREFAEIQSLHKGVVGIDDTPQPSAFLLQRTLAKIESYEAEKAKRGLGWRLEEWWRTTPPPIRALIAAQAVLMLVLAAGVVYFQRQAQDFSTLSGPSGASRGIRLIIGFQPGVSEETFRQTVRTIGGTIVEGPSALGLYTVQIPKESPVEPILAQLQANPNVRFVQRNPD